MANIRKLCKIWGSHSGGAEDTCLLWRDTVSLEPLAQWRSSHFPQHINPLWKWYIIFRKLFLAHLKHVLHCYQITLAAMDLHWGSSCDDHAAVKKLSELPLPAGSVSVQMTEKMNTPVTDLAVLLQGKHRNRILKVGDRLHMQHYGRNLRFIVKQICPFKGARNLTEKAR